MEASTAPRRHVRARQPAAARRMARLDLRRCRSSQYPERLNCAIELLDARARARAGATARRSSRPAACAGPTRSCSRRPTGSRTCCVDDLGLVPGNRVLLRGPNSPMMAACWFAVIKAGGVAVGDDAAAAREGTDRHHRQGADHATRCATRGSPTSSTAARAACPTLATVALFETDARGRRRGARGAASPRTFADVRHRGRRHRAHRASRPARPGSPRARCISIATCSPPATAGRARRCAPTADDVFTGSPPLAFTFGLGGLLLFPLRVGAATLLLEKASPRRAAAGDRGAPRDGAVHRADVLPRDGGAGAAVSTSRACASACRPARRCPRRRASCGRTRPASRSSTASAPPRCCTSSSRTTRTTRGPARPASRSPATRRA